MPFQDDEKLALLLRRSAKGEGGCLIWQGCCSGNGYPAVGYQGRQWGAHRLVWALTRGVIPDAEIHICHTCDNPKCINPEHLFAGTCRENMKDKVSKGRQAYGVRNGRAKLSESQVQEIIRDDRPKRVIAREYGVSDTMIRYIKSGKSWRQCRPDDEVPARTRMGEGNG